MDNMDIKSKLRLLKDLYEEGLISASEWEKRRNKILAQWDGVDSYAERDNTDGAEDKIDPYAKTLIAVEAIDPHAETFVQPGKCEPTELSQNIPEPEPFHYHLKKCIGAGGMGKVYLAEHVKTKEKVAVKVLDKIGTVDEIVNKGSGLRLKRFIREAQILTSLNHPNIVQIKEQGNYKGNPYLVMEYLEGRDISQIVSEKGAFSPKIAVIIINQVFKAVEYAYKNNVIHRDIKPANIVITVQRKVKLIDLGIAKILDDAYQLTASGQPMGTLYYAAPEQLLDSKKIDYKVDVYSLGATLYFMLCGKPPYSEYRDRRDIYEAKLEGRYIPLSERKSELPEGILQIVETAMAHAPQQRYSFSELYQALQNCY